MVKPLINQNPIRGVSILRIFDLRGSACSGLFKTKGSASAGLTVTFSLYLVAGLGGQLSPEYPNVLIDVLENFYGQQFAKYKIIPSLTFWPGPGFGFEGENIAFFVLGPFNHDLNFNNTERLKTLAIHEFGHAFANHILETSCINIIEETRPLFDPIAESMYSQSYPKWSYCVDEHFVRAGEVLIPEMMNNKSLSESNLLFNTEEKNFIYLPFIVDQLRKYRILEGLSYEESAKKTLQDLKKKFMP